MANDFAINIKVYYEDTDCGGIVYHANYLKFCERARTDWLRNAGVRQYDLLKEHKGFVIANMKGKFIKSAKLDDTLRVTCVPIKLRHVAINFEQKVFNQDDELLFDFECAIAFIDHSTGALESIPEEYIEYAKSCLNNNGAQ